MNVKWKTTGRKFIQSNRTNKLYVPLAKYQNEIHRVQGFAKVRQTVVNKCKRTIAKLAPFRTLSMRAFLANQCRALERHLHKHN